MTLTRQGSARYRGEGAPFEEGFPHGQCQNEYNNHEMNTINTADLMTSSVTGDAFQTWIRRHDGYI
jgi:hypothetical protein